MRTSGSFPWLVGVLLLGAGSASADRPPADSKPLSEILQGVEKSRPGAVISAEFERQLWEIVVCDAGGRQCREVYVDPRTGQDRRVGRESSWEIRPPTSGKIASEIARSVEDRKLDLITEIQYDDPVWEVKVRAERGRANLYIDPISADIRRCGGSACPPRN
jgi:hypothetical protein